MLRNFVRPGGAGSVKVRREGRRPDPADLERIQRAAEGIAVDDPDIDAWFQRYRVDAAERLAYDLALVRAHTPTGGAVADLGAVPPLLCRALAADGFRLTAIDIAPDRFAAAFEGAGIDARACNIEREPLPIDDASLDTVILHEVFEHLRVDLLHVLREVARVLKPGGVFLLSTPNLLSLKGILSLLLRGRAEGVSTDPFKEFSKLQTLGHMGHVREYTTVEVCDLLRRFELEPEVLVFRGRSKGVVRGPIVRAVPPLRPFFEVVARRAR
jgi:SAM-dependent methyltransferase